MTIILVLVLIMVLFLYSTAVWGLVLFKFWSWFVLPIFPALPEITFVQAIGLMLVIGLFRSQHINSVKKEYKDGAMETTLSLINPWMTLFFGWLAYNIFII